MRVRFTIYNEEVENTVNDKFKMYMIAFYLDIVYIVI